MLDTEDKVAEATVSKYILYYRKRDTYTDT